MWRIIIVAALLGAVTGYKTPISVYVKPLEDDDIGATTTLPAAAAASGASSTTIQALTTTSSSSSTSSKPQTDPPIKDEPTSLPEQQMHPEQAIALPIPPDPMDMEDISAGLKRRIITYDQRQEGQYNIRADLENFMIVLIPPNPSEGLNLLDILTKSAARRSSHSSSSSKSKRKNHFAASLPGLQASAADRFRQSIRAGNNNQNFNYLARPTSGLKSTEQLQQQQQQQQQQHLHQPLHQHHLSIADGPGPSPARFQEFIEGRTPYHVDISSSDSEHARLQPDRQVDVIPPPFPLSYQHLIKPYHLEAEPTVIQALPPAGLSPNVHGANNFLETYNQLLASGIQDDLQAAASSPQVSGGGAADSNYYRVSRSIRSDNLLDTGTNSLTSNAVDVSSARGLVPIYRAGLSLGASKLYPPIDVPHIAVGGYLNIGSNARTFTLKSEHDLDDDDVLDSIAVPSQALPADDDDLDLDLNSASFISSEAKRLLGNAGLERCAPGQRRDSYGVCREIEGY